MEEQKSEGISTCKSKQESFDTDYKQQQQIHLQAVIFRFTWWRKLMGTKRAKPLWFPRAKINYLSEWQWRWGSVGCSAAAPADHRRRHVPRRDHHGNLHLPLKTLAIASSPHLPFLRPLSNKNRRWCAVLYTERGIYILLAKQQHRYVAADLGEENPENLVSQREI